MPARAVRVRSITLFGGPNISPWAVGRYHGRCEISRPINGADGSNRERFGKEDLTVARAGVGEETPLAEGEEI